MPSVGYDFGYLYVSWLENLYSVALDTETRITLRSIRAGYDAAIQYSLMPNLAVRRIVKGENASVRGEGGYL